jgi:hypothetical protein
MSENFLDKNFSKFPVTSNLTAHDGALLNIDKNKN